MAIPSGELWPIPRFRIMPVHGCYDEYIICIQSESVSAERDLNKQHHFLSVLGEILGFHKCLL